MGREKYKDWQKQLVIQNIAHYLSNMVKAMLRHGHVWVPVELLTLVAQIQPSAAKLIGQHFTVKRMMTQVIHKKTKRFSRQKKKKICIFQWWSQSPDMSRACFSIIKYKDGERPTNKQQQSISREETQHLVMLRVSRLQGSSSNHFHVK